MTDTRRDKLSSDSLEEADRERPGFSGPGPAAAAGLENAGNGIKITTEYFPGHADMDRAFGFCVA
jgi:uncharacterized protein involved in tellurium resistance